MNSDNKTFFNFNEIKINEISCQLSLIHMNIRSLRKNFVTLLSHINQIQNKISLLILTETNITDNENDLYKIHGFNALFLNRDGRGGGIAVYIKDDINFEVNEIEANSFETISIDLSINNKTTSFISVYRPPHLNINHFIIELDQAISKFNKKNDTIVVGDMNIGIKKTNITQTKYLDMLSSHGLQCMVTQTTRADENNKSSTCIDHLFVRTKHNHVHAAVVTTIISDHYAVFACVEAENDIRESNTNCQGTENNKISNEKVNCLINETNWNDILNRSYNTTSLVNNIYRTFCEIYEKSNVKQTKKKKRKDYPWLSDVLLHCCEIRDKLHKKWVKNKNNKTNEIIYKRFSNNLNKKLINAKNTYNMKQFIIHRNNLRKTWQIINEIIGKKTNSIDKTITKKFSK